MKIIGREEYTDEQLSYEVKLGARFVVYQYCISALIVTFKRPSDIYFIGREENAVTKGLGFSALTLLLGWWGFPWGPIYTIQSLWVNFRGGRDVTGEVLASVLRTPPQPDALTT